MNIIIVHNNTKQEEPTQQPLLYTIPETAYLRTGHPFFVPHFAKPCVVVPHLAVHISRLGRNVEERFAYRYYDAITVGVNFVAKNLFEQAIAHSNPWSCATGFDNAATVGHMEPLNPQAPGDLPRQEIRILIDGHEETHLDTNDYIYTIDKLVAEASKWYMLRQGDLLFAGHALHHPPVIPGQHLEAYLGDKQVLSLNIK